MEKLTSLMLDLNVLLDVVQRREPFYGPSAMVLTVALSRRVQAFVPAHALTTLYYLVRKASGRENAEGALDRVPSQLDIAPIGGAELRRARALQFEDFEDSVVASSAEAVGCEWIITRDSGGFERSPVKALTPEQFLAYSARLFNRIPPE